MAQQQQLPDYVQLEEKLPDYVTVETEKPPTAGEMIQKVPGVETGKSFLGRAWDVATTPLIPVTEPTMEEWVKSPSSSATRSALSQATSPLAIASELIGGIGILKGLRGMRSRVPSIAASAAEETPKKPMMDFDIETGEIFEPNIPIKPMFNPKGIAGQTGIAQKAALEPPVGTKMILKQTMPEIFKSLMKQGYVPGGVHTDGRPFMIYKGKPIELEELPLNEIQKASFAREAWNLPRGMMSVDPPFMTSAAFRQALPMVGTKNWFKAWNTAAKAYGNEAVAQQVKTRINNHPLFKRTSDVDFRGGKWVKREVPSFADEIGLRMTDLDEGLNLREEALRSSWAEKIPGYGKMIRASNRAYTSFLNDLRANTLDDLVATARAQGQDPSKNLILGKQMAEFINDATGRGSLKMKIGPGSLGIPTEKFTKEFNLEQSAKVLADTMFSPRLVASRMRMLNPATYITANPLVRKQYLYANLRTIGSWWTLASLAEMSGVGSVSKDPSSADFGKIRIGNTRLDPGGGFQQWLVLANRMRPQFSQIPTETDTGVPAVDMLTNLIAGTGAGGYTSSTSDRHYDFGQGYKPETRGSIGLQFAANKLHPVAKLMWDIAWSQEGRPVYMGDRMMQLYLPMVSQDLIEIMKEDPSLIALIGAPLFTGMGGGMQTYEGFETEPTFTPMLGLDKYDIKIGGGR